MHSEILYAIPESDSVIFHYDLIDSHAYVLILQFRRKFQSKLSIFNLNVT